VNDQNTRITQKAVKRSSHVFCCVTQATENMLALEHDTGITIAGISAHVNDQEMSQAVGKRQRQDGT